MKLVANSLHEIREKLFPRVKSEIQIFPAKPKKIQNPRSKTHTKISFHTVSGDVEIVNEFVYHAIWVRLYSDFNNHAFGNCVNFSGKKVTAPPPPHPKSESARTPIRKKIRQDKQNKISPPPPPHPA